MTDLLLHRNKQLRPHQVKAIDMLRDSLRSGHRTPLLQGPTGFGKTLVSAKISDSALAKGHQVLFMVPALSLIDQTLEAFAAEGITDVGVIQGDHHRIDPTAPLQIASIQTLMKRQWPDVGLAIVDEAHVMFKAVQAWLKEKKIPFVGLSATPWAKGLGRSYDDLVRPVTLQELIDLRLLTPFRIFAPHSPDLKGVKTVAGDYHQGDLGNVMNK